MVDISYLGFGTEKLSWSDRLRLMEAPSLPFDGMNEAGLAVGMMAVPEAGAPRDPRKVTLDSLQVIRLLLDHAASVDEAISLFEAYNVDWGSGPPLHYLVADVAGNSAVIEFVRGEMNVLRNEQPWQVATNFVISGKSQEEARSLCPRYRRASDVLQQAGGSLSPDEAMSLLEQVSQEITMWSVVYDMSDGQVAVAMGRDYGDVHRFKLGMK
jgi:predicted choloylglycine hydrolase